MIIEEHTFTGFYPSSNPFLWYYDETKRTMFDTSINVQTWKKEPSAKHGVGEKIKIQLP